MSFAAATTAQEQLLADRYDHSVEAISEIPPDKRRRQERTAPSLPPAEASGRISPDSMETNARAVIAALGKESPPRSRATDLCAAMEAAASPPTGKLPIAPKHDSRRSGSPSPQLDDTQLQAALEALDAVQQFAAAKSGSSTGNASDNGSSITPGQRLALFLKDQLLQREEARRTAEEAATAANVARQDTEKELETCQSECAMLRQYSQDAKFQLRSLEQNAIQLNAANVELKAKAAAAERDAARSREELATVRTQADATEKQLQLQLEVWQQRLAELEMKTHLASYVDPMPQGIPGRKRPATANFHNVDTREEIRDVFADLEKDDWLIAKPHENDDGNSVAESDDTVTEAEATVRMSQQVQRETSRVRQEHVARDAAEAVADRRHQQHAMEEKLLRSEICALERKCEKADAMLLKANHAMRVLHDKLQKERHAIAALQEEKTLLQSQLIAAQQQPALNSEQLASLLGELASSRARVETLAEERAALAARLEAVEDRLTVAGQEHVTSQATAERDAAEKLAAERSRSELLEAQVRDLVEQLGRSATTAAQLATATASMAEARARAGDLAAQLDAERAAAIEREAEMHRLAEASQSFAAELMDAREHVEAERAQMERLLHENAGLQGKVESLSDAVTRLERDGGIIESLAEGQAEMTGRLRQAEALAAGARTAAETARREADEHKEIAGELEQEVNRLRQELVIAMQRQELLQSTAAAAAAQLTQLSDSHAHLEKELEAAATSAANAQKESVSTSQRLIHAENTLLEAGKRQEEVEAALEESQLQVESLQQELHDAAAAMRDADGEIEQLRIALNAAARERDDERMRSERSDALIKTVSAENDALRRAGVAAEDTNQTLVDNMCDMTGLIDAVAALQQRNRLLAQDCDSFSHRASRAECDRDALTLARNALERELEVERERVSATQAALQVSQAGHEMLRGDLAVATRQLQALEDTHSNLRAEFADLQRRDLEGRATLAASSAECERLRTEAARLASSLDQAHSQVTAVQGRLRAVLEDRESWSQREIELREMLNASDHARKLAEGKLVLARQRESRVKEASTVLRQLQTDIESTMQQTESLRLEKDAAEDRCAELTGRCMVLLDQAEALEAELAHAKETILLLENKVSEAIQHATSLEKDVALLPTLQSRITLLEAARAESGQWCDGMADELEGKHGELQSALKELESVNAHAKNLEDELGTAQERCMAAEGAAALAAAGAAEAAAARDDAQTALEQTQRRLSEILGELETLKAQHNELGETLEVAESGRLAALLRAETSEKQMAALRDEVTSSNADAQAACAAKVAVEAALQHRVSELEASAAQSAALEEARLRQIKELQGAVQAGTAACTALVAKVESAVAAEKEATAKASAAEASLQDCQRQVAELTESLAVSQRAAAAARTERERVSEECESHGRSVQQLELQCHVLRQQIDFLQASASQDAELSGDFKTRLEQAYEEQRRLQENFAMAKQNESAKQMELQALRGELDVMRDRLSAADERVDEARRVAAEAKSQAEAARAATLNAENRCSDLQRQLELAEFLREQIAREAAVAQEQAMQARVEATAAQNRAVAADRARQAAEMETSLAVRDAEARATAQLAALTRIESAVADGPSGHSAEQLEHVAAELQALQSNLGSGDAHATPSDGRDAQPGANNAGRGDQRPALLTRLAEVQQGVARLAGEKAAEEEKQGAAVAAAERDAQLTAWAEEKAIMKAVCKLALAVTMDQVAGSSNSDAGNAETVAAELAPIAAKYANALDHLGLASVWASLHSLVQRGATRRDAMEEEQALMQEQVLMHEQRANYADAAIISAAERAREIVSCVQRAVGQFHATTEPLMDPVQQLETCMEQLYTSVQRLLRRHRSLTRHVNGGFESTRQVGGDESMEGDGETSDDAGFGTIPARRSFVHKFVKKRYGEDEIVTLRARYGRGACLTGEE